MNDDQTPGRRTHSEEYEALLLLRMFRIMEQARMRIVKNSLGFFKPNSMLDAIALILPFVPIEPEHV
jgi:hypothetical protein